MKFKKQKNKKPKDIKPVQSKLAEHYAETNII